MARVAHVGRIILAIDHLNFIPLNLSKLLFTSAPLRKTGHFFHSLSSSLRMRLQRYEAGTLRKALCCCAFFVLLDQTLSFNPALDLQLLQIPRFIMVSADFALYMANIKKRVVCEIYSSSNPESLSLCSSFMDFST